MSIIGKKFEEEPDIAININNLKLWSDWALLHIITLFVSHQQSESLYNLDQILIVVKKYHEDFNLLLNALKKNCSKNYFKFYFREESYVTFPVEGQKRWWLEAKVRIDENNFFQENCHWESPDYTIGQVCVTKGFPKSDDYVKGSDEMKSILIK